MHSWDLSAKEAIVLQKSLSEKIKTIGAPGHLVGIEESAEIILSCTGKYRIPEPTRLAHIEVGDYKRKMV